MKNIIKFEPKNKVTMSGRAKCLSCSHNWIAVSEPGYDWLVCPQCELHMGKFIFNIEYRDPHWTCICGCDYFQINQNGIYCPACGIFQEVQITQL